MSAKPSLARRLEVVKPSATIAMSKRAAELQAQGVDVISFGVGEPDFETPEHIRRAAKEAVDKGSSHYTNVRGIQALREAICEDSKKRRGGFEHTPDEVVVSVGAKHSLFNLALALFDPGDEVIIPTPCWVSYPEQVRMFGGEPVLVESEERENFLLSPEKLARAVTKRTKALMLCTPSNPTGAAYSAGQLKALAEVARQHPFWVITDEIYGRLVYGGFKQTSLLEVAPDLRDRIVIVDGVSKTYAMTGWRIGWMLAPREVANACDKAQGQATTNPTAVAQYAAIAALKGDQAPIDAMREVFEKRRQLLVEGLNTINGVECRMPEGAFYAFPSVRAWLGKRAGGVELKDDLAIANWLLEAARCAVVPGSAFNAPGYLRLSYATSEKLINEGIHRIRQAATSLTG